MQSKKRALGKGLAALLPTDLPPVMAMPSATANPADTIAVETVAGNRLERISIDSISPNPHQPRGVFDEGTLNELAESIRELGLIQPIIVTPRGESYLVVAGERRWRAARIAGLTELPVISLQLNDQQVLEYALVENLQRENLNPMEEARAYRTLIESFGVSQEQVAARVGKGRPTIANALRLLKLPLEFQQDVEAGRLTPGHARAVLSLEGDHDQKRLRDAVIRNGLSVREAEQLSVEIANRKTKSRTTKAQDPHARQLREALVEHLGCRVTVKTFDPTKGKIDIYYSSLDELERVLAAMGVELG
jgi:ParB family transcriptional regulator, chromosome partitioning protein